MKSDTSISTAVPQVGDPHDEMLTKKELAGRLKVTIRTIENWQREGFLPYIKISSVVLFHWPEIIEHLKANFKVCRRGVVRPRT
jgi:predicted site-specific integrase-resolvase